MRLDAAGWTGSRQFEKDIRRQAQDQGYKVCLHDDAAELWSSADAPLLAQFHSTGLTEKSRPTVAIPTPREEDMCVVPRRPRPRSLLT